MKPPVPIDNMETRLIGKHSITLCFEIFHSYVNYREHTYKEDK